MPMLLLCSWEGTDVLLTRKHRGKKRKARNPTNSISLMEDMNRHVVCKSSVTSYAIFSLSQQLGGRLFDVLSASMPSMAAEMVVLMRYIMLLPYYHLALLK